MDAIEKRFGGNTKTKKVQKTLLKQQYKNFADSNSESLDQIHDRLQKLISQLEILGVSLSQEDINLKFLRSLPSELRTHTLMWRNKTDLEEQSLDDLFNSLKIYEAKVKISTAASVSAVSVKIPVSSLPNMNSLNQIDAYDLEEIDLKWQMVMLTVRVIRFLQRTGKNLGANGPTSMGFDMSKVECYNCHKKGHFTRECRSPKDTRRNGTAEPQRRNVLVETFTSNALVSQWSNESFPLSLIYDRYQLGNGYHDVPLSYTRTFMPPKPDLVFNNTPNDAETDLFTFNVKLSLTKPDQALSHTHRPSAPIIEDWVSDSEDESETKTPQNVFSFVQPSKQVKSPRPSIQLVKNSIPTATFKTTIPKPISNRKHRNRKACFVPSAPIIEDWVSDSEDEFETKTPQNVPGFVQSTEQSKPVPITAVRPVSSALPKIKALVVNVAQGM
nr:hypothetical protein [Tanacetum cinerariifolium]